MTTYQTIEQANITGIDGILVYLASALPLFIPMLLFAIWCIVTLGTYFGSKRFGVQPDFFASSATGSFIMMLCAFLMTFTSGIISSLTLSICFVIFTIFILIFFFSRER